MDPSRISRPWEDSAAAQGPAGMRAGAREPQHDAHTDAAQGPAPDGGTAPQDETSTHLSRLPQEGGSAAVPGPGSSTSEPADPGSEGRSVVERLGAIDIGRAGDLSAQRRELRELIEQLRALERRERSRTLLERDEVVAALADALRHAVRLEIPQEALGLAGAVERLSAVLGPAHRHTLTARFGLAGVYRAVEDPARAAEVYAQVLEGTELLLGADHPHALTVRHSLAAAYRAAGMPERAVPLNERLADDAARILGPAHPDALSARHNLARAYEAVGDHARALALDEDVVQRAADALGPHHPYCAVFARSLERARRLAGEQDARVTG